MTDILLRINSPEICTRLREEGMNPCICTGFKGWDWLIYDDWTHTVHGVGDDDEIPRSLFLAEFTADCGVDCGVDVEMFINEIKLKQ